MAPDPRQSELDRQRAQWRQANLMALWESPTAHKPPPGPLAGHIWPWEVIRPLAMNTTQLTSPEIVERRVLQLTNPYSTSPNDESSVKNLAAAIQILLPGEAARPHRHSMNALRFVLEGEEAVTVVDGKPCPMQVGDLILTPAWTWHEHHHLGTSPVMWLDVLDVPLHSYLETAKFEPGPIKEPRNTVLDAVFAAPNFLPEITGPSTPHSPVFRYPFADAVAAVAHAPRSPCGARIVRYVNPVTGGSALSTIDCRLIELGSGERTIPYLTNANAVAMVVEGEGETSIGGKTFQWRPMDLMTIPQENWVTHLAFKKSARLLVISDREALRRLGLFEETYGAMGHTAASLI
jgi:gentisate 1,2-dioxygenase